MKRKTHALVLILALCTSFLYTGVWGKANENNPLFAENKGQLKDQFQKQRNDVFYYGSSDDMSYYFKNRGISYQLYKQKENNKVVVSRVDMEWVGADPAPKMVAENKSGYTENYYQNKGKGITGVHHFADLRYKALYQGVDLHYYYKGGSLKYDFEVAAGADYKQIRIRIDGVTGLNLGKDGSISISTPNGIINEGKPVAYQAGREIPSDWVLKGNQLSFELSAYDPSLPVIIDPLVVRWGGVLSTSSGTASSIPGEAVFNDYGNLYMPFKRSQNLNGSTSYMTKAAASNGFPQWEHTLQLNNGTTSSLNIYGASTSNNHLYLCGAGGNPANFATSGAYQTTITGSYDCIIAKYDTAGTKIWATFYGGSGNDSATSCKTDALGNTYICGLTKSANIMASAGAYQPAIGGASDAFVAKFDDNGMRVWSTYYGGTNDDAGNGLALNGNRIFVAGTTNSAGNIALSGFQSSLTGTQNAFLLCMDTSGAAQWSTYYGADTTKAVYCVAGANAVYLIGNTNANTNIATTGSYQPAKAGAIDGFLAKFDMNGLRQWGTYFGGNGNDIGMDAEISNNEKIYICGNTTSNSGIATSMSYNSSYAPPNPSPALGAAYLIEFDNSGQRLYGTYYNLATSAKYCAVSSLGDVAIICDGGGASVRYLDFAFCNEPQPVISASAMQICSNDSVTLSIPAVTGASYRWYRNDSWISTATSNVYSTTQAGTYKVVVNNCPSGQSDTIVLTAVPAPSVLVTHTDIPCYGTPVGTITVTATGGTPPYAYAWDGLSDTTAYISGLGIGTYIVHTTDSNSCGEIDTVIISQDTIMQPSDPLISICAVTVDSATGKNLVVWEKTGMVKAISYNVYRESSTSGQYDLIGTVPVNDPGTFLDNTAIPLQQSYSYKIAEVDSCDREWPLSGLHKTIHLSANVGTSGELNLSWNAYEGITYSTYNIERSNNGGDYVLLNQVSATTLAYSDLTPPSGVNRYRVYIDIPAPCTVAAAMTFQRVASNIIVLNPTGISDPSLSGNVRITPNPTNGLIHIVGSNPFRISVYDLSGKLLVSRKNAVTLDIGGYAKGAYLVCLFDKKGTMYYKQKVMLK